MTRSVLRGAAAFAATTGVVFLAFVGGAVWLQRDLSAAGALGVAAAVAAVATGLRAVRAPRPPMPGLRPVDDLGLRPFHRLLWLRQRVAWGGESPRQFAVAVVPLLSATALDRLRRNHGAAVAADPAARTRLLGPELAQLVDGRAPDRVPSLAELVAYVRRIEDL